VIFILGGNGFLGSSIVNYCIENNIAHQSITKKNYSRFFDQHCNIFINCNGNSKKFLANEDPILDYNLSVNSVYESIKDFSFDKYIYLSSSEVYNDTSKKELTIESGEINSEKLSFYGFHKYISELLVKKHCEKYLILRLGGFVGHGLKKNPIFDLINNQNLWISMNSSLQFINIKTFANYVFRLITQDVTNEIINIAANEPVCLKDVYDLVNSQSNTQKNAKLIINHLNVNKLENILNHKIVNSFDEIRDYLNEIVL
jgi:nucleoside-diphosphate-sugar epimerase